MILESGTTLVANLAAAVAANQLQCSMSYADHCRANGQFLPATQFALTSGTARVSLVSMPSSGTQRQVKQVSIYNADTSTATIFVYKLASDVSFTIMAQGLLPGETVWYGADSGWHSRNSAGGEEVFTNFPSITTNNVTGVWTSGISSSNVQGLGSTWTISRVSSDVSILANVVWSSGYSGIGSTVSTSGLNVASTGTFASIAVTSTITTSGLTASNMTTMNLFVNSTITATGLNVSSTISCSGLTVSSIATTSRLSVILLSKNSEIWTSGISIGNATAGGSLILAISSTSSKVAAFVVNGSSSSFTRVVWAAAQVGDIILTTVLGDAAVSSISSGLVPHSHCTQAGQIEFRLSNVSTLVQNQSSKTWNFVRITPF